MSETRTEWTIELPYAAPPIHGNSRGDRHALWRHRNELMDAVHTLAIKHQLPRGLEHAGIVLRWRVTDARRRDADNLGPSLKACCDALTRGSRNHPGYGLTSDDDWQHVTSGHEIELDRSKPSALLLWITDLSGTATGGTQ